MFLNFFNSDIDIKLRHAFERNPEQYAKLSKRYFNKNPSKVKLMYHAVVGHDILNEIEQVNELLELIIKREQFLISNLDILFRLPFGLYEEKLNRILDAIAEKELDETKTKELSNFVRKYQNRINFKEKLLTKVQS